ncbi:unnamed protein product [Owenia fusiformis]|uniref:Uncharacterized protein n=1 Tax=Owenia fusiformis TaxID=6347 RepID=A0A8J1U8U9_OWEFU|nr:unnamed protein product [Owenia fusiformis]
MDIDNCKKSSESIGPVNDVTMDECSAEGSEEADETQPFLDYIADIVPADEKEIVLPIFYAALRYPSAKGKSSVGTKFLKVDYNELQYEENVVEPGAAVYQDDVEDAIVKYDCAREDFNIKDDGGKVTHDDGQFDDSIAVLGANRDLDHKETKEHVVHVESVEHEGVHDVVDNSIEDHSKIEKQESETVVAELTNDDHRNDELIEVELHEEKHINVDHHECKVDYHEKEPGARDVTDKLDHDDKHSKTNSHVEENDEDEQNEDDETTSLLQNQQTPCHSKSYEESFEEELECQHDPKFIDSINSKPNAYQQKHSPNNTTKVANHEKQLLKQKSAKDIRIRCNTFNRTCYEAENDDDETLNGTTEFQSKSSAKYDDITEDSIDMSQLYDVYIPLLPSISTSATPDLNKDCILEIVPTTTLQPISPPQEVYKCSDIQHPNIEVGTDSTKELLRQDSLAPNDPSAHDGSLKPQSSVDSGRYSGESDKPSSPSDTLGFSRKSIDPLRLQYSVESEASTDGTDKAHLLVNRQKGEYIRASSVDDKLINRTSTNSERGRAVLLRSLSEGAKTKRTISRTVVPSNATTAQKTLINTNLSDDGKTTDRVTNRGQVGSGRKSTYLPTGRKSNVIYYQNRFIIINPKALPSNKLPGMRKQDSKSSQEDSYIDIVEAASNESSAHACKLEADDSSNHEGKISVELQHSDKNDTVDETCGEVTRLLSENDQTQNQDTDNNLTMEIQMDETSVTMDMDPRPVASPRVDVRNKNNPSVLKKLTHFLHDNRLQNSKDAKAKLKAQNDHQQRSHTILKKVLNVIFLTTGVCLFLAVIIVIIYTSVVDNKSTAENGALASTLQPLGTRTLQTKPIDWLVTAGHHSFNDDGPMNNSNEQAISNVDDETKELECLETDVPTQLKLRDFLPFAFV